MRLRQWLAGDRRNILLWIAIAQTRCIAFDEGLHRLLDTVGAQTQTLTFLVAHALHDALGHAGDDGRGLQVRGVGRGTFNPLFAADKVDALLRVRILRG